VAKTVILIDDDQDDLDLMRETIKEMDRSILCISFIYPEEALRVVTDELIFAPNYIFIDINMPVITGDKLLREFRKVLSLNSSVITMFSTSMPQPVSQALIDSGASYTFEKPNNISDLRKILTRVFSS
jgi:CheY-like chemotaxis protein